MYATCLFCNAPFEKNESLEAFPVGRRLAFDEAKGRLWVVCKRCERWSLSPLDERWEAIEQAERLFRDTRKRVSTDNIGLAKVAEGTTLIRIGAPQRSEFAAWRYGDQFGRRRKRQIAITGGVLAGVGGIVLGGVAVGVGALGFVGLAISAAESAVGGHPQSLVTSLRDGDGQIVKVRRHHLGKATLSRADDGSLTIKLRFLKSVARQLMGDYAEEVRRFEGSEAHRVTGLLLPHVNRFGGNQQDVETAVGQIEVVGSAQRFVDSIAQTAEVFARTRRIPTAWNGSREYTEQPLMGLKAPQRLALEMALHEEAERRALEGELAELERAWRDAEEIAAISDDLVVPDTVRDSLDQLKKP